jgi:hypothetical protein
VYWPYVLQGAWIRDNRAPGGIMLSGWSAEHIGDANQPHYWDDLVGRWPGSGHDRDGADLVILRASRRNGALA